MFVYMPYEHFKGFLLASARIKIFIRSNGNRGSIIQRKCHKASNSLILISWLKAVGIPTVLAKFEPKKQ